MAGASKAFPAVARSTSFVAAFLSLVALFSAFLLFYYARYSSSSRWLLISDSLDAPLHLSKGSPNPAPPPEYSFLASLEKFLTSRAPAAGSPGVASAADGGSPSAAVKALDDSIWKEETERLYGDAVDPWSASSVVRVYVYEMPAKFTYDLLWLFRNTYRETSNLTSNGSPVHRLIEQEALKWVTDQPAWQRSGGRDHILPVHHPWSFKSVRRFMKKAIWLLPDMDSTGNWYKPGEVWLEKDLILPYVPNVDLCDAQCLHDSQSKRSTLLFFRGRLKRNAGGKIRSKLAAVLHDSEGVVMLEGSAGEAGKAAAQTGMRRSLFCLSPAGDTPSSARLFDAIVSGCIPVIVSAELELPFEGILDYRKIALFVSSNDAVQPGWLINFLKNMDSKQIREMQTNLAKYARHFLFSSPAQPLGAEDLAWRMIAGKLVNIKLHTRRSQRVVEGSRNLCTCECRAGNITRSP